RGDVRPEATVQVTIRGGGADRWREGAALARQEVALRARRRRLLLLHGERTHRGQSHGLLLRRELLELQFGGAERFGVLRSACGGFFKLRPAAGGVVARGGGPERAGPFLAGPRKGPRPSAPPSTTGGRLRPAHPRG